MSSMTHEEPAAGLAQSAETRASAPPAGIALATIFGTTVAHAATRAQEIERQQQEDAWQRRMFLADARDRGVSDEDAEKILTLAHSDDVRYGLQANPYDFADAALQTVEAPGDR